MAGPEAAGLDTGTYTAALAGEGIKDRFGTVYSVSAVTKLLYRLSVELKPRFHFQISEVFNALTYLRFLKRVVRFNSDKKLFWIADNARYHHSKLVKEWVELNRDKIELFFLPAYSPEFNAVEHIWRMTKRKSTHNRHFATLKQLHHKVFRRFNRYQGNSTSLKSAIMRFLPPVRKRARKT